MRCTNDYCLNSSAKCVHFNSCGGAKLVKVPYASKIPGLYTCFFMVAKCAAGEIVVGKGPRLDDLSVAVKGTCIDSRQCTDGNVCT